MVSMRAAASQLRERMLRRVGLGQRCRERTLVFNSRTPLMMCLVVFYGPSGVFAADADGRGGSTKAGRARVEK